MDFGTPIPIIIGLVLLSIILLAVGILLRRRGRLCSRQMWFIWVCVCVLPLAGGVALYVQAQIDMMTGETPVREDSTVRE